MQWPLRTSFDGAQDDRLFCVVMLNVVKHLHKLAGNPRHDLQDPSLPLRMTVLVTLVNSPLPVSSQATVLNKVRCHAEALEAYVRWPCTHPSTGLRMTGHLIAQQRLRLIGKLIANTPYRL